MSEIVEQNDEPKGGWLNSELTKDMIELLATVIMSIATIATAWSGYQAARWGGEMSVFFNQAGANRTESVRSSITGGQLVMLDITVFTKWLDAAYREDAPLEKFYAERFRDEFKPAFDAWIASDPLENSDAPSSPFSMVEYQVAMIDESIALEEKAAALFQDGLAANQQSDDYIANSVLIASCLFFAGVSTRFKTTIAQLIMIVFGTAMLIYGLYNVFIYPVA